MVAVAIGCGALFALRDCTSTTRETASSPNAPAVSAGASVASREPDLRPPETSLSSRGQSEVQVGTPATVAAISARTTLSVRVVDQLGSAVADARILLDDARHAWSAGSTDARGELEIAADIAGDASQITATHAYHARATAPFRPDAAGRQTLVLHAGASIRGEVTWLARGGPAIDVRVLAIPTEQGMPAPAYVARARAELPSTNATKTRADGTFEIAELDATRRYFVIAVADGCFSSSAPPGITPGGEPVRLELGRLFGVRVAYFDATTRAPVEVPAELVFGKENQLRLPTGLATVLPCHGRWAELAGVPPALTRDTTAQGTSYFFVGDFDAESIGPLPYRAALPGYLPTQGELAAYPAGEFVFEHSVHLVPSQLRQTTSLYLTFHGEPDGLAPDRARTGPEGVLVLEGPGGRQKIALHRLGPAPIEIPHVLQGIHHWRVSAYSATSNFAFPSNDVPPIELGAEPVELAVDLAKSGAIEVAVDQIDGSRYVGPLALEISNVTDKTAELHAVASVRFDHAPFTLVGLGAGRYALQITAPLSRTAARTEVSVERGRTTTAKLDLH